MFKFKGPNVSDVAEVKAAKSPRRLPVILTAAEVDSLLSEARSAVNKANTDGRQYRSWRDFVMIQTGVLAGPRVAELCSLEVSDVDLVGAVLNIREGKGKKDRNVPISEKLVIVLREWIGQRRKGWLFPGPKGKKLDPQTFQRRLIKLAKAAKILKPTHPHLLRHCFATMLVRKKVDVLIIQKLLGHANVGTTQIYAHVAVEDMKSAVDLL